MPAIPQGSELGTLLFILYTINFEKSTGSKDIIFSDDTTICTSDKGIPLRFNITDNILNQFPTGVRQKYAFL
jgi:hypothetical protein